MHRNLNSLIGNPMEATDGEIGKVEEFYFDDQAWIIVYLIVKTGSWLSGRKVLISPVALVRELDRTGTFPINLTKQQIKDSPDIDTDLPVSRQKEMALHQYYPWQTKTPVGDLHLRSTHAISGYQIETSDGQLGHLRDFIIDDETWHIEYLVIEMHSWLTGQKVLIARNRIKEIQWATSKVLVNVSGWALENSPAYDESAFFHPETRETIFDNNRHLK
jgi:uncharacterized protein YrrD